VHGGVVPVLVTCLSQFRSHDDMLADVYKFAGPTYNFELVQHCLCALANILDAGTKVCACHSRPWVRIHFTVVSHCRPRCLQRRRTRSCGCFRLTQSAAFVAC